MGSAFNFEVVGCSTWDILNDNIDVEITINPSTRYGATFVTLANIASLFDKNRLTGECASGTYLWAADMILVRDLEIETL